MNARRLLECFESVALAPTSISRLRRFVLELAIRGKLVPQDPTEGTAGALLSAIDKRRTAVLLQLGQGRVREPERDSEPVGHFAVPPAWRWVYLSRVGAIVGGGTPPASDPDNFAEPGDGTPWLTPADLGGHSERFIGRGARDLSADGLRLSSATVMPAGTVLFTSRAPIGYVAIAQNPISTNQGFKSIVPFVEECSPFIATVMRALAPTIAATAPGTTFKEASGRIVARIPFPLPPLGEQERIVAKVDELMTLCDQLEAARTEREAAVERVATATLARLGNPTPASFATDVRFAIEKIPILTARPNQILKLRRAILNLAVRGKLAPQVPSEDTPAAALRGIAAERIELVRNGLIRRRKPLVAVRGEEHPFEIPSTWIWTRIGEAALFTQYGTSLKSNALVDGVPVLTMGNIQNGTVVFRNEKRIPRSSSELPELFLKRLDLLYNRTNSAELVGKTGIYLGDDDAVTFASYLIRIRLSTRYTDPRYVNIAMNAPDFRDTQIVPLIKKQTGQANVNGTALSNMLIPLPPLAEQRHIVAKVDQLMALCDRLEANLALAFDVRRRLLDALVAEALEPLSTMEVA